MLFKGKPIHSIATTLCALHSPSPKGPHILLDFPTALVHSLWKASLFIKMFFYPFHIFFFPSTLVKMWCMNSLFSCFFHSTILMLCWLTLFCYSLLFYIFHLNFIKRSLAIHVFIIHIHIYNSLLSCWSTTFVWNCYTRSEQERP